MSEIFPKLPAPAMMSSLDCAVDDHGHCLVCSDAQWDSLAIPINLAFFFHSAPEEKLIAMYPSLAGATESLLSLNEWETLAAQNPI